MSKSLVAARFSVLIVGVGIAFTGMSHLHNSQQSGAGMFVPTKAGDAAYRHAQAVVAAHTVDSCHHYVVCGGVHSLPEYFRLSQINPLAKSFYSPVGPLRVTVTDRAFFAYDSYRIGNKIYWTRSLRFIRKGEPILSDGNYAILMRCGNLISLTRQTPVEDGPPPSDLYPPDYPLDLLPPDPVPSEPPNIADNLPPSLSFGPEYPMPPFTGMETPSACCFVVVPPPFGPAKPPAPVVEPGTGLLLAVGLGLMFGFRKRLTTKFVQKYHCK